MLAVVVLKRVSELRSDARKKNVLHLSEVFQWMPGTIKATVGNKCSSKWTIWVTVEWLISVVAL